VAITEIMNSFVINMIKTDYIKEQLAPFHLAYYRFSYIAKEEVRFNSYKGTVFRGGLGHALKDKTCLLPDAQCVHCCLNSSCIYVNIFESPVPEDSKYFAGQPYAPHPFIIEPPLEKKNVYRPGEVIDFKLILVGSAVRYLPHFINAFIELGQRGIGRLVNGYRGKCMLNRVESLGSIDGEPLSTLFISNSHSYQGASVLLDLNTLLNNSGGFRGHCRYLRISFVTPTIIKFLGHVLNTIDFKVFMKNIFRRISVLSYFYCGHDFDLDYNLLLDYAGQVKIAENELNRVTWNRVTGRQRQRFKAEGFKGDIAFQGDLELFMPFILLGQYLNLGKGTSFGYGKYVLKEICP